MPTEPQRTCVGCRKKASRASLLRIVAVDGTAMPDPQRRMPGRGANVHRSEGCIALALRRKSLSRALRVADLDSAALLAWIGAQQELPPARAGAVSVESSGANGMSTR